MKKLKKSNWVRKFKRELNETGISVRIKLNKYRFNPEIQVLKTDLIVDALEHLEHN